MLLRFLRLKARGGYALFTMPRMLVRMLPHGHSAINRTRALLTAHLARKPLLSAARASLMARRHAAQARVPLEPGEGFLTIVA
jgi:hypothetical protein